MLDAHMTAIARDRASGRSMSFPLSEAESARLLMILKDPDSELSDFSDALTIIVRSRGFLAPRWGDDPVGKQLFELLRDNRLSRSKRSHAFDQLRNDVALLEYSRSVIDDPSAEFADKMTAFDNLAVHDPVRALTFAKGASADNGGNQLRLALYVAKQTGDFQRVRDFVAMLPEHRERDDTIAWQPDVLDVVADLGEALSDSYPVPADDVGALIARAIEQGALIRLDDAFNNQTIALQSNGYNDPMRAPGRWMKESAVITRAASSKPLSLAWLSRVTAFFQIADDAYQLTTLQVTLGAHDRLETRDGAVAASDIRGEVWLRVEPAPGGPLLKATWRDVASGVVQERTLETDQHWQAAVFRLSFDPKLVERLSYNTDARRYR